jgi:hypothetical protein
MIIYVSLKVDEISKPFLWKNNNVTRCSMYWKINIVKTKNKSWCEHHTSCGYREMIKHSDSQSKRQMKDVILLPDDEDK